MDFEVIERLMEEKGVKASDVAKATGIPSSVFTDWKKGRYTPKADKLYAIAKFFGVPMETFFEPMQKELVERYKENLAKERADNGFDSRTDLVLKLVEDKDLYILIERIINSSDADRERFVQMGKLMGLID